MDFLSEVEKKLDLPPAEKAQVMRELRSHYCELRDEFVEYGMNAVQAGQEAAKRLGDPYDLASRLRSVHCTATWKMALLTIIPFLGLAFNQQFSSRLVLFSESIWPYLWELLPVFFGLAMLVGSIIALRSERRPMWLATWLPIGVAFPIVAASYGTAHLLLRDKFTPMPVSQMAILFTYMGVSIVTLYGLVALWVFRQIPKWRAIVAGIALLGIAVELVVYFSLDANAVCNYSLLLLKLFSAPLVLAIAIQLFAKHPYGNAALASLFLYTHYLASIPRIIYVGRPFTGPMLWTLGFIVTIIAVIVFTRESTWQRKLAAICAGIVARSLLNLIGTTVFTCIFMHMLHDAVMEGLKTLALLSWVVLIPLLFQRYQTKKEIITGNLIP